MGVCERSSSQQSHRWNPRTKTNIIFFRGNDIWGRVFCKCCQPQTHWYDIYTNAGEMCFIPMNVHNELFNGVRQLRWQHLSHVVSTFSTSIRLLSSFFIKHCTLPPSFSLFLSISVHRPLSLFLWYPIPFS